MPGEEISVYDPSTDKRFIIKDGEVVEPPEDDVETGDTPSSSSCGCCSTAQKTNTEDIALTVVNEQEGEVVQVAEDIVEELISDIVIYETIRDIVV